MTSTQNNKLERLREAEEELHQAAKKQGRKVFVYNILGLCILLTYGGACVWLLLKINPYG